MIRTGFATGHFQILRRRVPSHRHCRRRIDLARSIGEVDAIQILDLLINLILFGLPVITRASGRMHSIAIYLGFCREFMQFATLRNSDEQTVAAFSVSF